MNRGFGRQIGRNKQMLKQPKEKILLSALPWPRATPRILSLKTTFSMSRLQSIAYSKWAKKRWSKVVVLSPVNWAFMTRYISDPLDQIQSNVL